MNNKTKGLLSVLVPVIAWGISFVSTEYLLSALGPMTIGAIRFVFATLLLYFMLKKTGVSVKIEPRDHLLFLLAGAVGIALYFYFENLGIKYISASPAALIIAAIPMFTLMFEAIVFKKRVKKFDVLAVIISICGVALIVDIEIKELFNAKESLGYLLMFGAVLTWVVYSMSSKPLFKRYSYLTILFYQFLYSLPFFVPFTLFEDNKWELVDSVIIGHLVFLSIVASVFGFYYYAKAMDLLGVSETAIFINFLPIVTIAFSYFYLGTMISQRQWMGGILVISSVTMVTIKDKNRQKIQSEGAL